MFYMFPDKEGVNIIPMIDIRYTCTEKEKHRLFYVVLS